MPVPTTPVAGLIRPATKSEIPEIASVIAAAFGQFHGHAPAVAFDGYVEESCNLGDRWDDAEVLVFETGRRILGTISFYADASREGLGLPSVWAGFRTLAVHPAARGRGVGRLLTGVCLERARRRGARAVGIRTAAFMTEALSLYEKTGFRRCPRYDLRASEILGFGRTVGDVSVIAYQLDLV